MEAFAYILFWGLILYGFITPKKHVLLYILFGVMPFGAFAIISPRFTGVNLTVAPIVMLIFIARTFFVKGGLDTFVDLAFSRNKLLFLFVFWVIAIFTTLTMPRFFEGDVMVFLMNGTLSYAVPLEHTTQNITQLTYLSISVLAVYAFTVIFDDFELRQHAIKAFCITAFITILTGLLDFASQYVSLDFIIQPFKNASYALLSQNAFGRKRISGLMPEPSAFSALCMSLLVTLYFFRRAIDNKIIRERIAPILIIGLIAMVWLSTSSSGLVSLAIFGALVLVEWAWRAQNNSKNNLAKRGWVVEFWLFNLIAITLLTITLLKPALFDPAIQLVDTMVFKKTESQSYEERTMWTAVSWQALLDSYGIGIGVGSTRASNGVVALASGVGFLGAFFYFVFLLQSFIRKANKNDQYGDLMITAFRWSFLPPFIASLLANTSADFGLFNAFLYGLVAAIALEKK